MKLSAFGDTAKYIKMSLFRQNFNQNKKVLIINLLPREHGIVKTNSRSCPFKERITLIRKPNINPPAWISLIYTVHTSYCNRADFLLTFQTKYLFIT
jgi:hypothetical protein